MGNDITVSLGEIVLDSGGGSGETYYVDENGETHVMDGGDRGAAGDVMIMVPAPDDVAGDGTEGSTGDAPAEKLPIEFTGEVRDFTIPAGAKITNAMGKEVSFDNVTKGSLVQLILNETTGVVEMDSAYFTSCPASPRVSHRLLARQTPSYSPPPCCRMRMISTEPW